MSSERTQVRRGLKRTIQIIVKEVPINLHASFKAHCAQRGISMKAKLIRLMQETVAPHEDR